MFRNPYDYYITDEDYQEAKKRGISRELLRRRIRDLGWSKKRALETPVRKCKKYPKGLIDTAKRNGIPLNLLSSRVCKGWDFERAAYEPVNSESERIQKVIDASRKKDKYPQKILEMAQQNGINIKAFRARVRNGWNLYIAATTPVLSKHESLAIARSKVKKKSGFCQGNQQFWDLVRARKGLKNQQLDGGTQCSNQKDGTSYR